MAGVREVRCVGPSAQLADRKAGAQRSINLYLSAVEGLGEDRQYILRSCPGVVISSGPSISSASGHRGMMSSLDGANIYYLSDNVFKRFNAADGGDVTQWTGLLETSTGYVRMAQGNDVIVIVDGLHGYVANLLTQTLARITDTDWLGSHEVEFLDGYFIFVKPDSEIFYISAIDDPTSLDALDFSSADRLPDKIIAARVSKQELYLFGSRSTEIWVLTGGSDFPFVRYSAAPIDIGLVGRRAVVKTSDALCFVGRTERGQAMVFMMVGTTPKRISTLAVEEALLADGVDLENAWMWTYQTAGAEFVGIDGPGMLSTWVFDIASGQWHERAIVGDDGEYTSLGVEEVATANGKHYAALPENDGAGSWAILRLSNEAYKWADTARLPRERTWPHLISPSYEDVRYASLELACSTGNGGTVTLEVSNDGGSTWGPMLTRSLGTTGRRMERVRWHFLGQARDRVFRVRCSDAVPFNIHGAQVDAA